VFYLDLTLPTAEENLACDEALLEYCEEGFPSAILRFWEPASPFVVVGYANKIDTEVNTHACRSRNIRILRRCSGGGTVLQAQGCLNYSLVLPIASHPALAGIAGTNHFVMDRNRAAVESLVKGPVQLAGHTDLAVGGRKFCGNAQRRRRHFILFHGCFLLHCNIAAMEDTLRMPSKRPDYRMDRTHSDFVMNLELPADQLKGALRAVWDGRDPLPLGQVPNERISDLVRTKYITPEWNEKF
jgi:lipoate---protein ligase